MRLGRRDQQSIERLTIRPEIQIACRQLLLEVENPFVEDFAIHVNREDIQVRLTALLADDEKKNPIVRNGVLEQNGGIVNEEIFRFFDRNRSGRAALRLENRMCGVQLRLKSREFKTGLIKARLAFMRSRVRTWFLNLGVQPRNLRLKLTLPVLLCARKLFRHVHPVATHHVQ